MKSLWLLLGILLPTLSVGQPINAISGGAARSFVEPMGRSFSERIIFDWQPMGRLVQSVSAGQPADMLIVTPEVLERLAKEGRVNAAEGRPIAKVGMGVAVHQSAPTVNISTPDAIRKLLLDAKSVVHINPATGTSGKYVVEMFQKLGIVEAMKPKTTYVDTGYAVAGVGRGEIEVGIHQISEILPVPNVKLLGEVPKEFQRYTVYVAVPTPNTQRREAVMSFIGHLTSPQAVERLAAAGYTAP
jgi:molybdate transport system substrate-binding protein